MLQDVASSTGLSKEMSKMKKKSADRKALEAEAREAASEVKGDWSEAVTGAAYDAGVKKLPE